MLEKEYFAFIERNSFEKKYYVNIYPVDKNPKFKKLMKIVNDEENKIKCQFKYIMYDKIYSIEEFKEFLDSMTFNKNDYSVHNCSLDFKWMFKKIDDCNESNVFDELFYNNHIEHLEEK